MVTYTEISTGYGLFLRNIIPEFKCSRLFLEVPSQQNKGGKKKNRIKEKQVEQEKDRVLIKY